MAQAKKSDKFSKFATTPAGDKVRVFSRRTHNGGFAVYFQESRRSRPILVVFAETAREANFQLRKLARQFRAGNFAAIVAAKFNN